MHEEDKSYGIFVYYSEFNVVVNYRQISQQ